MKMKKKNKHLLVNYLIGAVFLLFGSSAFAQTTVSGTVIDETGATLPGVTILVKGTSTGTTTDFDGKYKLSVPEGATTLVYTYVGYLPIEQEIGNRSTIDVTITYHYYLT